MSDNSEENAQDTPLGLTSKQAAILLKGDLKNLAQKVNSGKPLSPRERNFLQSAMVGETPSTLEFVDSLVELAEQIGVTRKTVQRWRNVEGSPAPRPDGRWNVAEWRAFKALRLGEDDGDEPEVTQAQARCKQILLQNERIEMNILKEKKELIPKIVAQQVYSKLVLAAKTRCFASITRFVTLARTAENSVDAAEEIRKEMMLIWKAMEDGEWLK